jgi:hypothetical protein
MGTLDGVWVTLGGRVAALIARVEKPAITGCYTAGTEPEFTDRLAIAGHLLDVQAGRLPPNSSGS